MMRQPIKMWQEDIDEIVLEVHDWFIRHPLGTTEEGYDHFKFFLEGLLEPFSVGDYRNYN